MSILAAGGSHMKILGVSGSLQSRSSNKSLLARAAALCASPVEWHETGLVGVLPFYDADLDVEPPPEAVKRWRAELDAADAIVIASPEYGHGMPGSLKNAIDWIIGSGNLNGKPVAATCAGAGPGRGEMGLAMLVQTLHAIDALVVWNAPIVVPRRSIAADGTVTDGNVDEALRELLYVVQSGVETARRVQEA